MTQTATIESVVSSAATEQRKIIKPEGQWCYEDYLNLPDDGLRYEIIKGVLYVANAPNYDHQFVTMQLTIQMGSYILQNQLGILLHAPFEVHLSEESRPLQPDVLFIGADRQPTPGSQYFAGAPDVVVEVISPSSIRTDRQDKFDVYEAAGVREYWLVDPKTQAVEVYALSGGEYALFGQFIGDEVIQSTVLPGLAIITKTLFATGGS